MCLCACVRACVFVGKVVKWGSLHTFITIPGASPFMYGTKHAGTSFSVPSSMIILIFLDCLFPVWFGFGVFFFFVLLWHPNFSSFFCPSPFSLLWLIFYFIYFLSLSVSSSYFLLFPVPPFFLPSSFPQLMATNTQMVSLSLSVSHPLFSFSLICFYPSHLPPPTLTLKHISLSPKTFPFSLVHSFIRPGCCRINPPPLSCSPLIV